MVSPSNCVDHNTILISYFWRSLIENLETAMNVTKDETFHETFTEEDLDEGFRVYLYLGMCHKRVIENPLLIFYHDLFGSASVKNIFLSLNRLIKVSENLKEKRVKDITRKLLNLLETKVDVYYNNLKDKLHEVKCKFIIKH